MDVHMALHWMAFRLARDIFNGDAGAALDYMLTKNPSLGGQTPSRMCRTYAGYREVITCLNRIKYGTFS